MKNKQSLVILFFVGYLLFSSFYVNSQVISTFAGCGIIGYSGDGGAATVAKFYNPAFAATDAIGNIYINDGGNNRIRKVDYTGIIHAFAGSGCGYPCGGYTGDGGPASAAELTAQYIYIDGAGNCYFPDNNFHIRKINTSGIITTIAGIGTGGYSGDGGPATAAQINYPRALAVDGAGNLLFTDCFNHRIRKIDAAGIITTIAGTGVKGYSGDGGPATAAIFCYPGGLALDRMGNLYISDSQRVRKINTAGIITTIAGNGVVGFFGDGGPATAARVFNPGDLAVDAIGNIYIADKGNFRIRKINILSNISTIAGTGATGFFGDGSPATVAKFGDVADIGLDCGNNLYIADENNQRIRVITYNRAPVFIHGHNQSFVVCESSGSKALDSMLMVFDIDTLQTETWSILKPPANGTLAVAYNVSSTGDTLIPAGTSYTPATGFSGMDTFRVIIADCGHLSDTTNFYVTVIPPPDAGVVTGADTVCTGGAAATLHDAAAGGTWTVSNSRATVTGGVVTGVAAGKDTVIYTVANSCGMDTAMHVMTVKPCVNGVAQLRPSQGESEVLRVYPNPANDIVYMDGLAEPVQYKVLNVVGMVVQTGELSGGHNNISLKGLSSGVYVLEVSSFVPIAIGITMTGGGRTIIRIIKR